MSKWTYDELRATDTREQGWQRYEELLQAVRQEAFQEAFTTLGLFITQAGGAEQIEDDPASLRWVLITTNRWLREKAGK